MDLFSREGRVKLKILPKIRGPKLQNSFRNSLRNSLRNSFSENRKFSQKACGGPAALEIFDLLLPLMISKLEWPRSRQGIRASTNPEIVKQL